MTQSVAHLPQRSAVPLRAKQLTRLLGVELPAARVEATLAGLQMQVTRSAGGWQVTPAAHRFDIGIEADLIEEVARIIGYQAIPEADAQVAQRFGASPDSLIPRGKRMYGGESDGRDPSCTGGNNGWATQLG